MRITDYEQSKNLSDVAISLTRDEAEELHLYLCTLLKRPSVSAIHLSEITNGKLERDLRLEITQPPFRLAV
ncbi:MAG: hypothetical protein ABL949_04975 [Fimbriimonadaceae bacterium]